MPVARVIATVSVPGFHNWPDAPQVVGYLGSRHRHQFKIRAEWKTSSDRQIEFHLAQQSIYEALNRMWPDSCGFCGVHDFGDNSCETIATRLLEALKVDAVEVWEDGENGARVE